MTMKKSVSTCFAAVGILILILDSKTALAGAAAGIALCIRTAVPSLFPFLFLCGLLTDSLWGSHFTGLRILSKRLGIPAGSDSLLLVSVLGGYPAGAAAVADAYRSGTLSRKDAEHFLTFCSNAGPAFLFGMTARQFPNGRDVWAMWLILIMSSFLTGQMFAENSQNTVSLQTKPGSVSTVLNRSVKTVSYICGWIIMFRILTDFLTRWIFRHFPETVRILFTGLLELSNGCVSLGSIGNHDLRFLICSSIHAFGGLCVTMQTASVTEGLSLKPYLLGKLIQTPVACLLSLLYLRFGGVTLMFAAFLILHFPIKPKKSVDFQKKRVYNADIITGRTTYAVSEKN